MTVKERLKKFVEYKKISDRQFSLSIGVSAGYVNSISKSVQPEKLSRITATYPELNPIWLLMGDGEMLLTEKKEPQEVVYIPSVPSPSEILEELRENYIVKEERLLTIIESQQEVIRNQSELMKKIAVRPEGNVICADAAGSDFKR